MTDELLALELLLGEVRWQRDALCAEPDYAERVEFFPERGESADEAREVCRRCLVAAECLDYALREEIGHGIWGGLTALQRRERLHGPKKITPRPQRRPCATCGGLLPRGRQADLCASCAAPESAAA